MLSLLTAWINENTVTGMVQRSAEWVRRRGSTIGGSALATLQGNNPYASPASLFDEKTAHVRTGASAGGALQNNIKMQWGTTFEPVITAYIEHELGAKVLYDNVFIEARAYPGASYSPDGFMILPANHQILTAHAGLWDANARTNNDDLQHTSAPTNFSEIWSDLLSESPADDPRVDKPRADELICGVVAAGLSNNQPEQMPDPGAAAGAELQTAGDNNAPTRDLHEYTLQDLLQDFPLVNPCARTNATARENADVRASTNATVHEKPADDNAAMRDNTLALAAEQIILLEFKCPYNRLPTGEIVKYYIPQILMGLDITPAARGLFVEAVFRQCTIAQALERDPAAASAHVGKPLRALETAPLARGWFILYTYAPRQDVTAAYEAEFNVGGTSASNSSRATTALPYSPLTDLSGASEALLEQLLCAPHMRVMHSEIVYGAEDAASVFSDLQAKYIELELREQFTLVPPIRVGASMGASMGATATINSTKVITVYGVLPWKLYKVFYNIVDKQPGYLQPWMPRVREFNAAVAKYNDPANARERPHIRAQFLSGCGMYFDDE